MGRTPGIPNMKATLERHVSAKPSLAHRKHASRALKIPLKQIPVDFHHVKDLAIWVDTVLWCGGDHNARNSLMDRMLAKEARVIVEDQRTARRGLEAVDGISANQAAGYMSILEGEVAADAEESLGNNDISDLLH